MGGTTAKICLIKNQTPKTARVFEVARTYRFKKGSGMPISIPVIDMVEIGAGGGSIAHIDEMNQIRVGPESAGSEPGPACYGRGGDRPAVTDADLMLGKLDPSNFAGGTIALHPEKSAATLAKDIGGKLSMDTTEAAWGVSEVVDENMANAARVHAVENGEDLSGYTMIAFGGAAPLHAARLCEKLGIDRCLVPEGAGVGSAIGFLRAPFSFEANRSVFMTLAAFDPELVARLFREMEAEATGFVRSCDADAEIRTAHKVFMRYTGQGWEIPVEIMPAHAQAPDAATFQRLFEAEYTNLFSRPVEGMQIEITVWSVNAFTPPPKVKRLSKTKKMAQATSNEKRRLFDAGLGTSVEAAEFQREELPPGSHVTGPAVVTEVETTVVVPASRTVVACADSTLDVHRRRKPAKGTTI